MKTIYELIYRTDDGKEHNLLFSSKSKALNDLRDYYFEGSSIDGHVITVSFLIDRILF